MSDDVEIVVDGRSVMVPAGIPLAAALWRVGVRRMRRTGTGGPPRGPMCGIGVCFDCLVTLNDRPTQRACSVTVRAGDRVVTGEAGPA